VGGVKSNSGELGDLVWGDGYGGWRQLYTIYYGGSLGIRCIARIDNNSSHERDAGDCRPPAGSERHTQAPAFRMTERGTAVVSAV